MIDTETLTRASDMLGSAQSIVVVIGPTAHLDQVAAGMGLAQALREQGKDVQVVAPRAIPERFGEVGGASEMNSQLGNRNLQISFDYQETAVDKVSYHIGEESNKFFLTIKPQRGQKPLDHTSVEFVYTGAEADALVLVQVPQLEVLENLYFGYEEFYQNTKCIHFGTFCPEYAQICLETNGQTSSEVIWKLLQQLGAPVESESATNLLLGLESATNSFQSLGASAEAFETAAALLRAGARRARRSGSSVSVQTSGDQRAKPSAFASKLASQKNPGTEVKISSEKAEAPKKPASKEPPGGIRQLQRS